MSELQKYIFAGVINTITGYCVFLAALRLMGIRAEFANAVGYAVALTVAFILNKFYVFAKNKNPNYTLLRFSFSFAIAFVINQGVLIFFLRFFSLPAEFAQILSMSAYTVSFYLLNKWFVFRDTKFLPTKIPSTKSSQK